MVSGRVRIEATCKQCHLRPYVAKGLCKSCYAKERTKLALANGMCRNCWSRAAAPTRALCQTCLDRNKIRTLRWKETSLSEYRAYQRKYKDKVRQDVIQAYGGQCACCGIQHLIFLQLDHINDDGGQHRKALGVTSGFNFARALIKQGFPPGLQVLCANCHQAKTQKVACPCKTDD